MSNFNPVRYAMQLRAKNAKKPRTLHKRVDGNLCYGHLHGFYPDEPRPVVKGCVTCIRKQKNNGRFTLT